MSTNRIVLTGSSGRLGRALAARFRANGLDVLGIDRTDGDESTTTVVADLSDEPSVAAVLRSDDVVVHVASMHGFSGAAIDQGGLPDKAYLDLNVAGTWHLYNAIAAAGVRRVILTSTVGVLGRIPEGLATIRLDDRYSSVGIYGTTKRFQEDTAQSFALTGGISTLAIRPPAFVSVDPVRDAFLRAMGALDLEDVVGVHAAAVAAAFDGRILSGPPSFEAVFAAQPLPFTEKDESLFEYPDGQLRLVERYWPGSREWFESRGFRPEDGLNIPAQVFDTEPAERRLGWHAANTFDAWYSENVKEAD